MPNYPRKPRASKGRETERKLKAFFFFAPSIFLPLPPPPPLKPWVSEDGVKRAASWVAYLSHPSRVLVPKARHSSVSLPLMTPLPVDNLNVNECDILRNWASVYGAVRQRPEGRWDTPVYGLYRYVPRDRECFFRFPILF